MAWRLYAQRTTTGAWLHTDVPMGLDLTWQLNASGYAAGFIPAALDRYAAADGHPMWWERGTTIYAEQDGSLEWVGLCSFQRRTPKGREVEFKGLSSAFDLIGYDGLIRQWQPDPFEVVQTLVDNAQGQPNGDVGFIVTPDGKAPTYAGDEQPPQPRPENVKRRKGETLEHFRARQDDRGKEQDVWDRYYGDRRPYVCAWWEAPYVAEEIAELAREIPFDWHERHRWTDRDALEAKHELVLTPAKGVDRADIALVEGVNIAEVLDPTTDSDNYGNHVVMLGAGEGSRMRRSEVGARDGRVRTTRFGEAKHVHNLARLRGRARDKYERMGMTVKLDQAVARGELAGISIGDRLRVESTLFTGWCRVHAYTTNTRTGNVTLTFTPQGGAQ